MGIVDEDLSATRANLMELEEKTELVEKGKEQLEQVQEQLINEFMDLLERWKEESEDIGQLYEDAENKSAMARAMEGDIAVRGAANAQSEPIKIESTLRNIAGVKVPEFTSNGAKRKIDERGYGILGSSARIDETAGAYEDLVEQIITIAELETAMKEILDEIESIKRRVNAFEYQVLPDMRQQKNDMDQALMERERQEIFSLKKIKDMKEEEEKEKHE